MKASIKKFAQWTVFSTLCFVCTIAFMVLAGDEDPMNPIPFGRWALIKAIAIVVIAVCVWIGKQLYKKGYLPEYIDTVTEEE